MLAMLAILILRCASTNNGLLLYLNPKSDSIIFIKPIVVFNKDFTSFNEKLLSIVSDVLSENSIEIDSVSELYSENESLFSDSLERLIKLKISPQSHFKANIKRDTTFLLLYKANKLMGDLLSGEIGLDEDSAYNFNRLVRENNAKLIFVRWLCQDYKLVRRSGYTSHYGSIGGGETMEIEPDSNSFFEGRLVSAKPKTRCIMDMLLIDLKHHSTVIPQQC